MVPLCSRKLKYTLFKFDKFAAIKIHPLPNLHYLKVHCTLIPNPILIQYTFVYFKEI